MSVLNQEIPVLRFFETITSIPHPSYHEELLTDYIETFAKENQLQYQRDDMNNIVVYKDASKGYEEHPRLMLQAHLDMVAETKPGETHDFVNEGLSLFIKEGELYAHHTTLGADDGLGVALMLSILENKTLSHPQLECVFTVQEEVGLFGASALNPEWIQSQRMISLDGDVFGETTVTSCGGRDVILTKKLEHQEVTCEGYKITVSHLKGGHSGDAINQERGNAAVILSRLLVMMNDLQLESIQGGEKANAIPMHSTATFTSTNISILPHLIEDIYKEYQISEPDLTIDVKKVALHSLYSPKDSQEIIKMIYLAPRNVQVYSTQINHFPLLSSNLGILKIENHTCYMDYSVRGTTPSLRNDLSLKIKLLASLMGFESHEEGEHEGWNYDENSYLRKVLKETYQEMFHQELKETATHGGLETGIFKGFNQQMDIITLGADAKDIHTYHEHLNIQSLIDTYDLLVALLKRL